VTAQYSVNGGGTGGEFPRNILNQGEEAWNKWYQVNGLKSYVMVDFKSKQGLRLNGIGFKSANDCPFRDPDTASVFIFDTSNQKWINIAVFTLEFNEKRWSTVKFRLPACVTRSVLVEFKNNKDNNEIQLGEILFLQ